MEQNISILMADLSGYTALTETHGSDTAADLIEKYSEIVQISLVGDCRLHQRIGDEVMVVSSSPAELLSTAILLLQNTTNEHNFLQVHGGLHYGSILIRNNDYFGTTINLASRIAKKAEPDTFWCSKDFVASLENKYSLLFQSKGVHKFKNLSFETELFELDAKIDKPFYVDPVCRMLVNKEKGSISHPTENDIFFCSYTCRDSYIKV